MSSIDEASIDYPSGDFVQRFIDESNQTGKVGSVFVGLSPEFTSGRGNPTLKDEMKDALVHVLNRRAPAAALPLSLVNDLLILKHPMSREDINANGRPQLSTVRREVADVFDEIGATKAKAIRVKQLSCVKPPSTGGPFSVQYNGMSCPLFANLSQVTRLDIDSLDIDIVSGWRNNVATAATRTAIDWLLGFPRLTTVDVSQLQLLKSAHVDDSYAPLAAITIHFHPGRCQFSVDQLLDLLSTLTDTKKHAKRDEAILSLVDEWKAKDAIRSCEFAVHNSVFNKLISSLKAISQPDAYIPSSDRLILPLLERLFPSPLTTRLHLVLYHDDQDWFDYDDDLLKQLRESNVFAQLTELSMSFTLEIGDEKETRKAWIINSDEWNQDAAYEHADGLLRFVADNMASLEKLDIDFTEHTDCCSDAFLEPVDVAGPLPRLRELAYRGMPSLPFVVAVVQQAPNLRCLIVTSHPVEDQRGACEWLKELLDALQKSKNLSTLVIRVQRSGSSRDIRNVLSKENVNDRKLTAAIDKQMHRVVAALPQLYRASIDVAMCDLKLERNWNAATERLFIRGKQGDDGDDDGDDNGKGDDDDEKEDIGDDGEEEDEEEDEIQSEDDD